MELHYALDVGAKRSSYPELPVDFWFFKRYKLYEGLCFTIDSHAADDHEKH
jgi:hypothetical protein